LLRPTAGGRISRDVSQARVTLSAAFRDRSTPVFTAAYNSNPIGAAFAANASGFLQVPVSKALRRNNFIYIHNVYGAGSLLIQR
jgi:hypothetical protein